MKIVWQHLFTTAFLCLVIGLSLHAQSGVIRLGNPSFEDIPRHSSTPHFWTNCGFANESPPDIQPGLTFQVSTRPVHGGTYLGMVVRDNDTWESIGQLMEQPFQENTCYSLSIKLARSLSYLSASRELGQQANYISPTKLRIWAGFGMCGKTFLLGESDLVSHSDWKLYEFKLEPDAAYTHIIFEVFYQTPCLFPYNGNLLLDDVSSLQPIPCDTKVIEGPQDFSPENYLATNDLPMPIEPQVTPVSGNPSMTSRKTPPTKEVTINGVKRSEMNTGKTILLKDIQFEADSSKVTQNSLPALDELYRFMEANRDVKIEVRGHTNSWAADDYGLKLSTARAKTIADYLIRRGIEKARIIYKGYGKLEPVDTNETAEGRRKNQRVEIRIL